MFKIYTQRHSEMKFEISTEFFIKRGITKIHSTQKTAKIYGNLYTIKFRLNKNMLNKLF